MGRVLPRMGKLHEAAEGGRVDEVRKLLDAKVQGKPAHDINERDWVSFNHWCPSL